MVSLRARAEHVAPGARPEFEELFRSAYPDLHRYFVRRLGPVDAEDAVAETLTAVLSRWSDSPATLDEQRAWTFGFAANKLREVERARLRSARLASAAAAQADPEVTAPPDVEVAALDRARHLLAQLPDAERDAVYLTAVVGMSGPEAAAALGCSLSVGDHHPGLAGTRPAQGAARGRGTAPPSLRVTRKEGQDR